MPNKNDSKSLSEPVSTWAGGCSHSNDACALAHENESNTMTRESATKNKANKKSNKHWIALIGISLANFLGCLDFTIVNTGLPTIQHDLSANVTELQWVINSFMLALSATMVVMGRVADIYGRRKILYIGMLIFALSSLGAGLAPTVNALIVFRLMIKS